MTDLSKIAHNKVRTSVDIYMRQEWLNRHANLLPRPRGKIPTDNLKTINGIIHVLRHGIMWKSVPPEFGSARNVHNRFVRWGEKKILQEIFFSLKYRQGNCWKFTIKSHHIENNKRGMELIKKGCFNKILWRDYKNEIKNEEIHTDLFPRIPSIFQYLEQED